MRYEPNSRTVESAGHGDHVFLSVSVSEGPGLHVLFMDEENAAFYQAGSRYKAASIGPITNFSGPIRVRGVRNWWVSVENRSESVIVAEVSYAIT